MPPNNLLLRLPCAQGDDHIYIEQAPATAGAIFLQVPCPGGSVPFCRQRFETDAPGNRGVLRFTPPPYPHPGYITGWGKEKGVFHKLRKEREKSNRRSLALTMATMP